LRLLPGGVAERLVAAGTRPGETERLNVTVVTSGLRDYSRIGEHADPSALAGSALSSASTRRMATPASVPTGAGGDRRAAHTRSVVLPGRRRPVAPGQRAASGFIEASALRVARIASTARGNPA
jgi:hypothetical protein